MPTTITTIQTRVLSVMKDVRPELTQVADGDLALAIKAALAQMQQLRPRKVTELIDGADAFDYALTGDDAVLDDGEWQLGMSAVDELLFPYAATDQRPPRLIDGDDYAVITTHEGTFLRFLLAVPTAAQKFLLSYTTVHVVDADGSTLNLVDEEPLVHLAAAYGFRKMAAIAAGKLDKAISADASDRGAEADQYLKLATMLEKVYEKLLGGSGDDEEGAAIGVGAAIGTETAFSNQGTSPFFFHGRRK